MKLIGITGTYGKTSTAEMVYQYCLKAKIKSSLYCSNGLFINGSTRKKDLTQSNLSKKELTEYLKIDEELSVDIVVIEITAESTLYQFELETLNYDVVVVTSYDAVEGVNFKSEISYLNALHKIVKDQSNVIIKNNKSTGTLFKNLANHTFGTDSGADYCVELVEDNMNGLRFSYDGRVFHSNLITKIHLSNLACCIAILESLELYNPKIFGKFVKRINLRGRVQVIKKRKRAIVIDNTGMNLKPIIDAIVNTTGSFNFKVFYSIPNQSNIIFASGALINNVKQLKKGKFTYLTNENPDVESLYEDLKKKLLDYRFSRFEYSSNSFELFKKALYELKENEILIVLSKRNYRLYRRYMESGNGKL